MPRPAFTTDCSIEYVSAVPDADWFSDASVPGPPDPINDCQTADLAPVPEPPTCPAMAQTVKGAVHEVPAGDGAFTLQITQGADCTFDFQAHVAFPVVCPTFPTAPIHSAWKLLAPAAKPEAILWFKPKPPDLIWNSYSGGHSVSSLGPDPCAFDISLSLELPIPGCPDLRFMPARVSLVPPDEAMFSLSLVENPGDAELCRFSFVPIIDFPCGIAPYPIRSFVNRVPPDKAGLHLLWGAAHGDPCSLSVEASLQLPRGGGLVGQVISGSGNSWQVQVYPSGRPPLSGPGSTPTDDFTATVQIPGVTDWVAPVGAWIGPILEFSDPATPSASIYQYLFPYWLGKRLAFLASSVTLAGRNTLTLMPGSAVCLLYNFDGSSPPSPDESVTVWNWQRTAVVGPAFMQVGVVQGNYFVDVVDC
jgi:hypothetical protein